MGGAVYSAMSEIIKFDPRSIPIDEAVEIVRFRLYDSSIPWQRRTDAIEMITATENPGNITKEELLVAIRWLFDHYDFDGSGKGNGGRT